MMWLHFRLSGDAVSMHCLFIH